MCHHFSVVSHLWDPLGRDKTCCLNDRQPGGSQTINELNLDCYRYNTLDAVEMMQVREGCALYSGTPLYKGHSELRTPLY